MRLFKRYFITGLLVWIPLGITIWVLAMLVGALESVVPPFLTSDSLFGVKIPGFGLLVVILAVTGTGLLTANLLGQTIVDRWEHQQGRIP